MIRKSQVDIIQAVNEDFYKDTETVEAKQGFHFALSLGGDQGPLDPRIGKFIFMTVEQLPGTKKPKTEFIDYHECTEEEIGATIRTDKTKFMPIKET